MNRLQPVAGLLLLQLLLLSGCAMVSSGQPAAVNTANGITVETLADDSVLVRIATDAAFDFGSAVLRPAISKKLAAITTPYIQQPGAQVRVSGYTDNVGAATYNLDLSQQQARAVADVLRAQGFSTAQVAAGGYGEASPVSSNADAAGRYRNRRVEVLITVGDG